MVFDDSLSRGEDPPAADVLEQGERLGRRSSKIGAALQPTDFQVSTVGTLSTGRGGGRPSPSSATALVFELCKVM